MPVCIKAGLEYCWVLVSYSSYRLEFPHHELRILLENGVAPHEANGTVIGNTPVLKANLRGETGFGTVTTGMLVDP
jgi:hypothetical protein